MPPAGRDHLVHRRAIDRDGVREALLTRCEAVAGKGALREDDQVERPAAAAASSRSRIRSRFASSWPSFGSIWTAATRNVGELVSIGIVVGRVDPGCTHLQFATLAASHAIPVTAHPSLTVTVLSSV